MREHKYNINKYNEAVILVHSSVVLGQILSNLLQQSVPLYNKMPL